MSATEIIPLIVPLGDRGLLVRFGDSLSKAANDAAVSFARTAEAAALQGVTEVVANLVSVLLNYAPENVSFDRLAGEVRLLVSGPVTLAGETAQHRVPAQFDGEDIAEVALSLGLTAAAFIEAHNSAPLKVLATGFAPGFLYCGFHPKPLHVPRRAEVRRQVPPGTVLFAAGQTAITSTPIPTGWHVIGHTAFRNFTPGDLPPTTVRAGDAIQFEVAW
ncbi:5-oxoprolinase subunit B family protein [Devosia sp.]|uniref:5-oxoprolinase subunit B family protein n=1 Tax=Devosia sp. TaxID=1871048 RepID=UPI003BADB7EE